VTNYHSYLLFVCNYNICRLLSQDTLHVLKSHFKISFCFRKVVSLLVLFMVFSVKNSTVDSYLEFFVYCVTVWSLCDQWDQLCSNWITERKIYFIWTALVVFTLVYSKHICPTTVFFLNEQFQNTVEIAFMSCWA